MHRSTTATCSNGFSGEESTTDRDGSFSSDDETVARTEQGITGGNKKRPAGTSDDNDRESKITKKASNNDEDGGSASSSGQQQRETTTSSAINKTIEVAKYGIDIGVSSIPFPVCSCTGAPRRCYKNGHGRWKSACCTSGLSDYPLPLNLQTGGRIVGRGMGSETFKQVLEKLKAESYDFSKPIDLKHHWAKAECITTDQVQLADYGIDIAGVSSIHFPVCSCTGTPRRCNKTGHGGRWRSVCCSSGLSEYPLPLNQRGTARIVGREMSSATFKKVLQKLAAERYDFSKPIDLKGHWKKHGSF